jgi:hypothetical protein
MDFVRHLWVAVASTGQVSFGGFLASVHRVLIVALVTSNHARFRAGMHLYTWTSGHARVPGCVVPTAEIVRFPPSFVGLSGLS